MTTPQRIALAPGWPGAPVIALLWLWDVYG